VSRVPYPEQHPAETSAHEAPEASVAEAERACAEMKVHLATAHRLVEEARRTFSPEARAVRPERRRRS
jgi:hypothetical protein